MLTTTTEQFFDYAPEWDPYWTASPPSTRETIIKHTYPLESECRADGKPKEVCAEHLAVRVYGYVVLYLTAEVLQKIQGVIDSSERMKRDCIKGPAYLLGRDEPDELESKPMMGIIKGIIKD